MRRDRDVAREAVATEHRADERPPGAAIAVGERVDRLELSVREQRFGEGVDVGSVGETDQVVDEGGDAFVVGGHETRTLWAGCGTTDPHRFGAPFARPFGVSVAEQAGVHVEDAV